MGKTMCFSTRHLPIFLIFALMVFCFVTEAAAVQEKGGFIAVWDLENYSPGGYTGPDMGEILSAEVIEAVKQDGTFGVVERERLVLALEELQIGTTKLVEESTRLKLGKIAGAQFMIFGSYQVIQDKVRIDLRLVDVETGKILNSACKITEGSSFAGWIEATKEAALELLW